MSELMRQAMDTNQWTFDMLRDPGWQPDRDSYQSMRDGLVARLRTVEAERRDAIQAGVVLAEHLGEQLLAAEARVEALEAALLAYEDAVGQALRAAPNHWHEYRDPFELSPTIRSARSLARAALAVSGNQP